MVENTPNISQSKSLKMMIIINILQIRP